LQGRYRAPYREVFNDAMRLEMEVNVAYNFGEQHHWELNAAPLFVRWQRFPWDAQLATSAAFGLGLSYAAEVPELEVELEGESHKALIFWVFELTAGPPRAPWSVKAAPASPFGCLGTDGEDGVNAVGIGLRYQFR
jgi:hypothetical protein